MHCKRSRVCDCIPPLRVQQRRRAKISDAEGSVP